METDQNNSQTSASDTQGASVVHGAHDPGATQDTPSSGQEVQDASRYRAAYARKRALLSAIPPERFAKINIDIGMLLAFAMGVVGKLQVFYAAILGLTGIKRE